MEKTQIEALCSGDHKAFEEIFILYFNRVKIFINGIIKSDADAEELAQDIFVKLWNGREQINADKSLNAYIYTMARNRAFNFLKHKAVEQSYINSYKSDSTITTPEEICFAKEIELLIEMTVNQMPVRRGQIYSLSRNNGVSNDDIAIQLNISKKTVENQLSLALQEIRKVITSFCIFFL